ncbi:MAG: hypothetical protein GXP29_14440 [Planctomycetes bacterium]|nr:hypothetical protein [Planctomycetota bacterium]
MKAITLTLLVSLALFASNRKNSPPETTPKPESAKKTDSSATVYSRGMAGSVHDFSKQTGRADGGCSACHIPHVQRVRKRPDSKTTDAVTADSEPAVELFRIQGQRQTFVPGRYTPGPTSLICLGCHDGTVASSTIGSSHAMLAGVREGFSVPDGFVWRDHPIGIPYPKNNREYHPESFVTAKGKIRMPEGRMECVSCHDPHNSAGVDKMLVMSNRRSALCLTCHIK